MTILDFINIFNLIKPTVQEISQTNSSLPIDVLNEIYHEYDLRITSMEICEDLIIDLLMNTNISKLSFSVFHFTKPNTNSSEIEIGNIVEKGHLFFDKVNNMVSFRGSEIKITQNKIETINQIEFVKFLLKYLEFDFNRIFKGNKSIIHTKNISLDYTIVKRFSIIEILLNEIGLTSLDLIN